MNSKIKHVLLGGLVGFIFVMLVNIISHSHFPVSISYFLSLTATVATMYTSSKLFFI